MSVLRSVICPIFAASANFARNTGLVTTIVLLTINAATTTRMDGKDHETISRTLKEKASLKKHKQDNTFSDLINDFLPQNLQSTTVGAKQFIESGLPHQVGYGFLMGYSSGFCLKKVSKVLAFTLGGVFVLVQALSFNGYIDVHYQKVQREVEAVMDVNKDGRVDVDDLHAGIEKIKNLLGYHMPSGGGFIAGLAMGLRG